MTYSAPHSAIERTLNFAMQSAAVTAGNTADSIFADLGDGMAQSILDQAGKYAEGVLDPINRNGDIAPATLSDGKVTTSPGWIEAYRGWIDGGWSALSAPSDHGGMALPHVLNAACLEMWSSANMAFMLCPILSDGAILALSRHASGELQDAYLPKIVSGVWPATMNLTEPQAGSDLNALRAKAERNEDGTYRISGQKIFITYGEHDMSENIIHLVLARLPDAPAGTRGISLFLVPKFIPDADGNPGALNDIRCAGLEHKMGIHGSPTCTMIYGDNGGATGWLIGEENRGLACMFTMMNNARLAVGLQGVAAAERSTQQAAAFARERKQGRPPGWAHEDMAPIAAHADVQRMLMSMAAMTDASRAICYLTAAATDLSHRADDEDARRKAHERASLLTPVAKAFSTDMANEVTSLGVQVHGGMGFIEETGAAQHMRDVRIAAIYEGTNGIQAIDLVMRKLPLSGGEAMQRELADMRAIVDETRASNNTELGATAERLAETLDSLERAGAYLEKQIPGAPNDALAGATPFLRLFGLARGGTGLAKIALDCAAQTDSADGRREIAIARYFAENICAGARGLELSIVAGAASVQLASSVFAES